MSNEQTKLTLKVPSLSSAECGRQNSTEIGLGGVQTTATEEVTRSSGQDIFSQLAVACTSSNEYVGILGLNGLRCT